MNEEVSQRKSNKVGYEEILILCVIGVVAVVAAIGYVVAWLMGLRATTSPAHLLSVTTAQDFLAGRIPAIWGVSPTPGVRFDVALVLALAAVTSLAHLAWLWRAQIKGKSNEQFVPMRQFSTTHLRLLTQSGGLAVVGLLWLLIVVVTAAILGDLLGGLVLGTALSADLGLPLAYQFAGGQASAKLPNNQFTLGNSKSSFVMAPVNQGLMIFAGPRSGKSSGLIIPNVLHLDESSLIFTSTRSDILIQTAKHRSQLGKVWLYDPMHLTDPLPAGVERINWTPMSGCQDLTVALRHAEEFTHGVSEGTDDKNGFFSQSASRLLAAAFHMAAVHDLPMSNIPELIQERSLQTLLALAQQKSDAQVLAIVESLVGFRELNSIQATAAGTTSIFSTRFIADPGLRDVSFDPTKLLTGHNTLAIMAKSDLGGTLTASPLTTSLLTDIHSEIHRLSQAQPDGRLPISHFWLLDEFFALGGLSALPQMVSESAGRNHHLAIALQSAEQLTVLYGAKADSMWDLFGTIVAGSGVKSIETLRKLEVMCGGDAAERQGHDSKKRPMKGDRLLSHEIAALREHHWLAVSQSGIRELHPMLIKGNAYWRVSPFKELSQGINPHEATPLARWLNKTTIGKRNLGTKSNSSTPDKGETLKAEVRATEELISEEYALFTAETRDAVKNGLLSASKAALAALKRIGHRQVTVESGPSAEWPFRVWREKVIGDVLDRGIAGSDDALADDDGPVGALVSVGVPGAASRHPLPLCGDDHESWDFRSASSVADDGLCTTLAIVPQAVATTTAPSSSAMGLPPRLTINRHYTRCDICNQPVPPGEGWVWKEDGEPSWKGRHQGCPR